MDRSERLEQTVDELERALAASWRALGELRSEAQRVRRAAAIEHVAGYAALLRETVRDAGAADRVWFKLEFPDGRWDVAEQLRSSAPRVGDIVSFDDGSRWRVRATQLVRPRPPQKPPREFFVCALAA